MMTLPTDKTTIDPPKYEKNTVSREDFKYKEISIQPKISMNESFSPEGAKLRIINMNLNMR